MADTASPPAGKLINIDNGGTLTDICVIEGSKVWRTKTLTTPHDLSKCFIDGLAKASKAIFGKEDLAGLISGAACVRYSTTYGTNALAERRGQRLGLILAGGLDVATLTKSEQKRELFAALVGDRVVVIDPAAHESALENAALQAVRELSAAHVDRIVISIAGASRRALEARLERLFERNGNLIPLMFSHAVVEEDDDDAQRTWTAIFDAFLHAGTEQFLGRAERELGDQPSRHPLLIFRNDGHSGRIATTKAIKTYSSGPRGGLEGARALAAHHGFERLLSMDVGGTTTDIGLIENGHVKCERHGKVEGVGISFPLCDMVSLGVGGNSIVRASGSGIKIGPESVGSVPGPACFGGGGTEATMTDALLVQGLIDAQSFIGSDLLLDRARARAVVAERVGKGLGLSDEAAAIAMERAWVAKIAGTIKAYTRVTPDTVLAAFGGGGPLVACRIADAAGITRVVIPRLAAVFSAFGLGFSDIAHDYGEFEPAGRSAAQGIGTRSILVGGERRDVPLYRVEALAPGAQAAGPAVLEETYFTCRVDPGWSFSIAAAGDILLDGSRTA